MPGRIGLLLLCLPFLAGCIHLDQTIRLLRNGGVLVSYHYSVAGEALATLENGRRAVTSRQSGENENGLEWFTSEKAIRRHFTAAGFAVRRYRLYRRSGRVHVDIEVEHPDAVRAIRSGYLGALTLRPGPDRTVELVSSLPAPPAGGKPVTGPQAERLRALCDDLWLRLTIIAPEDLAATSGKRRGKRAAVWTYEPAAEGEPFTLPPAVMVRFPPPSSAWSALSQGAAGRLKPPSQP